ncbi:MAG: AbrB/MazE/SpoVT family DNA-binding domain-containing protein [Thermaerobacter sp.]|nr:AbrB/MazE/SpoVT family DNA-binding domain-containing protein [Thermaerobacter sp.]
MLIAKLSSKGQISIPQPIREAARLEPGDRVGFEFRGDDIVLTPIRKRALSSFKGVWRTAVPVEDLAPLRQQRASDWAAHYREED